MPRRLYKPARRPGPGRRAPAADLRAQRHTLLLALEDARLAQGEEHLARERAERVAGHFAREAAVAGVHLEVARAELAAAVARRDAFAADLTVAAAATKTAEAAARLAWAEVARLLAVTDGSASTKPKLPDLPSA